MNQRKIGVNRVVSDSIVISPALICINGDMVTSISHLQREPAGTEWLGGTATIIGSGSNKRIIIAGECYNLII